MMNMVLFLCEQNVFDNVKMYRNVQLSQIAFSFKRTEKDYQSPPLEKSIPFHF